MSIRSTVNAESGEERELREGVGLRNGSGRERGEEDVEGFGINKGQGISFKVRALGPKKVRA